jgi:tripartite-type tricarboxylate transporter receptor subunit TctC
MVMKISRRSAIIAAAALAMPPGPAWSQEYPSKPIRLVVPVSAGSGSDATARFLANALGKAWGVTLVVDNKPGAGAMLGTDIVAKAPADGYTLLFTYAAHYSNQWVLSPPFDAVKDFEPIARMANSTLVLATKPDSPYRTVRDLVTAAKHKPGALSYASAGLGSTGHMAGALLESLAGIELNHVPYKAASQVPLDAASGQVDVMFGGLASALPLIRSGRLRVLAVTSATRSAILPDAPTIAESGFPGYENSSPIWAFAPRGTPQAIVKKLSEVFTRAASSAEFKEFCLSQGIEADVQDAATVKAGAPGELEKWRRMVELTTPGNK